MRQYFIRNKILMLFLLRSNICIYCFKKCQNRFTKFATKQGTKIYCDDCFDIHLEQKSTTRRKIIKHHTMSKALTERMHEKIRQELLTIPALNPNVAMQEHLQPFQNSLQSEERNRLF